MPFGLLGSIGLPSLSSLTGGGNLAAPTTSTSSADSATGPITVGAFNPPAFGGGNNSALILAGAGVAIAWLILRRRR